MENKSLVHVLVVSFIGQGNVNPMLRLGKLLASKGLLVTLSTPKSLARNIKAANNLSDQATPIGDGFFRFEPFEDGWDETLPGLQGSIRYMVQTEEISRQSILQLVHGNAKQGQPVTCLIGNPFNSWVIDVAESLDLPVALLWIQSCACFTAYYHYFHNLVPFPDERNPDIDIQLPCMPLLKSGQVPTFLHPTTPYTHAKRILADLYKQLDKSFYILMETFEELEPEIIKYMSNVCPFKAIGPLFKHPGARSVSFLSDIVKAEDCCIEWLDNQSPSSVVYVAFGSLVCLEQEQWDEIAYGLSNSGLPFLWVVTLPPNLLDSKFHLPQLLIEKAGDKGKIVKWSPQEKVLAHQSIACFVTHCGWNSSMEALAFGVPVVTFPMWGDQVTNDKYLVDVFKVGVRMCCTKYNEKMLIKRDEVERCLFEVTAGPNAVEMKQNALKLKAAAEAAVAEGGSSDLNIQAFVEEVKRRNIVARCNLT